MTYDLDEFALECGSYCLLLILCMFALMDQFRGKFHKMQGWMLHRKLEIFKYERRNSLRVANYLLAICYFYIIMPFVALIGWTLLVLWSQH